MFASQAWWAGFDPQNSRGKSQLWWQTLAILLRDRLSSGAFWPQSALPTDCFSLPQAPGQDVLPCPRPEAIGPINHRVEAAKWAKVNLSVFANLFITVICYRKGKQRRQRQIKDLHQVFVDICRPSGDFSDVTNIKSRRDPYARGSPAPTSKPEAIFKRICLKENNLTCAAVQVCLHITLWSDFMEMSIFLHQFQSFLVLIVKIIFHELLKNSVNS